MGGGDEGVCVGGGGVVGVCVWGGAFVGIHQQHQTTAEAGGGKREVLLRGLTHPLSSAVQHVMLFCLCQHTSHAHGSSSSSSPQEATCHALCVLVCSHTVHSPFVRSAPAPVYGLPLCVCCAVSCCVVSCHVMVLPGWLCSAVRRVVLRRVRWLSTASLLCPPSAAQQHVAASKPCASSPTDAPTPTDR